MVFVADDLAAWLIFISADGGRKKLTGLILGDDQKRSLRPAAAAAVRLTAAELCPGDTRRAEELAIMISQLFKIPLQEALLGVQATVLEALQVAIAEQLKLLDNPGLAASLESLTGMTGLSAAIMAQKLTAHLLREIVALGSRGGPLEPLANQLDHDRTYLQGLRVEGKMDQLDDKLAEILALEDGTRAAALPVELPAYWATLREFGRALHRRMPQLLRRERDLIEIAAFATGDVAYRWLVGGAFAGKSALLYEAVMVGLPDEVDVVCYFLSRRASDASSGRFLEAVVPQLAYLCKVAAPPANVDQYHALWEQAVGQAGRSGRHLLLVVDGLDEDLRPPGSRSVASLLPRLDGTNVHVLVTSRPRPELPDDADEHPLRGFQVQLDPFEGGQELAELAKKEIYDLTHGDNADLAADVLGALTAAEGPLSLPDLAALRSAGPGAPSAADVRDVRRVIEDRAVRRSVEHVGPVGSERYQFAHVSLLEYAQKAPDLCDPEYRQRIHHWASRWRDAGWPTPVGGEEGTPRYLLEIYPSTLNQEPRRLAQLASDCGWINAAIMAVGVDHVLADLRTAAAVNPADTTITATLTTVTGQAQNLRTPQLLREPGYILRQMWNQAAEIAEAPLADDLREALLARPGPILVPLWTTRQAGRALSGQLGHHDEGDIDKGVRAVAVLDDGKIVTGGDDGRVLVWDLAHLGVDPVELGRHDEAVTTLSVLGDGRVVTGHGYGWLLVWDPAHPGADPVELGCLESAQVNAVKLLSDGRLVTVAHDGQVLVWDPARPGDRPVELGRGDGMAAVTELADGRVVTTGLYEGQVLVWNPAHLDADPVTLGSHDSPTEEAVWTAAVLADGRVVTGGEDGRVLIWNPAHPGDHPVELGHRSWPWANVTIWTVLALDDGRVLTGDDEGLVLLWDPAHPGTHPVELGYHQGAVLAAAALPDGHIVTGDSAGRLVAWDPTRAGGEPVRLGHRDWSMPSAVALLPDGRVVTGDTEGQVLVWDPAYPVTGPVKLGQHEKPTAVSLPTVRAMTGLADGRVVTGGADGRLLVWDPVRPGADPVELGRHQGDVQAVAVLPDRRVISSGANDKRVLVWAPDHPGAAPVEFSYGPEGYPPWVSAVAVLADGRAVIESFASLLVWDPADQDADPVELGRDVVPVVAAALADGRVVTGDEQGQLLIFDPACPKSNVVELGRHTGTPRGITVLADGCVVTGDDQGRVLVWDPAGTGSTQTVQLNSEIVTLASTQFSAAESRIVVAYKTGGFSLWSYRVDVK